MENADLIMQLNGAGLSCNHMELINVTKETLLETRGVCNEFEDPLSCIDGFISRRKINANCSYH